MQSNGIEGDILYLARQRSSSTDSMESPKPPLNPSGSTMSLGSRPPLVWLFNHIRQEGKTSLSKEDLQKLVGPQVDPQQLDLAFENLDADKDGVVSMDEFIAGFSRFWKETPDTPAHKQYNFNFTSPAHRTKRLPSEEHFEYLGEDSMEEAVGPDEEFQRTLCVLSSHNRHSMEQLWRSLKEANPELLTDFEEFVTEVSSEVEGAQRALDNQRKANKKEAIELDHEIESRLSAAQTTLHIQTSLVRQDEKAKLERRLVSKESELFSVRNQLQMLESEVVDTQQNRQELEQQCEDLWKEKQALAERLQESERKLEETQQNKQEKAMEALTVQQEEQSHQEVLLLQQKKKYQEEITKLRQELEVYSKKDTTNDEEVESLMHKGVARPDLLATTGYCRTPGGSLMAEIADKEGLSSPLLRMEHCLQPSPFLRSARVGSVRTRKSQGSRLKAHASLSSSLPNLSDIDSLDSLEESFPHPASTNRFSVMLPSHETLFSDADLEQPLPLPRAAPSKPSMEEWLGAKSPEDTALHPLDGRDVLNPEDCKPLEFIESLSSQPDYIFKILVVGNSYVGKSSFLMRLCNNSFSQRYSSTIGVDFYSKALRVDDKVVSLQLWDTAGQERFQSVTKAYYRGAQGVLLVYDVSQEESFIAVKSWINSINDNVEEQPAAMCLVGNKVDLDDKKEREVSIETGETFAKIYGAGFIETSAKTGYNVGNSLLMLVRLVKSYYEEEGGNKVLKRHSKKVTTKRIEELSPEDSKCCSR